MVETSAVDLIKLFFLSVGVVTSTTFIFQFCEDLWTKQQQKQQKNASELRSKLLYERKKQYIEDRDERLRQRLERHFRDVQNFSDMKVFPDAKMRLKAKIDAALDLLDLARRTVQESDENKRLSLEENLRVLSFTKIGSSICSMIMLYMFVRIQSNILGRELYDEIVANEWCKAFWPTDIIMRTQNKRDSRSKTTSDNDEWDERKIFLATVDYLSSHSINLIINNIHKFVEEVLKDKQLKEPLTKAQMLNVINEILESIINIGGPDYLMCYLVPPSCSEFLMERMTFANDFRDHTVLADASRLEKLLSETRKVLSSPDFSKILGRSVKRVVDELVEDFTSRVRAMTFKSSSPPKYLLPEVCTPLFNDERFLKAIRSSDHDFEEFYQKVYAGTLNNT